MSTSFDLIKLPGLNSVHLVCDDMSSQTRKCATVSQHLHVTKSGVSKCTDSIRDAGARCCCIKVEGHSPIQKTTICKNAAAIFWRNIGKGAEVPNRGVSADFSKGGMSLVWVWWVWVGVEQPMECVGRMWGKGISSSCIIEMVQWIGGALPTRQRWAFDRNQYMLWIPCQCVIFQCWGVSCC